MQTKKLSLNKPKSGNTFIALIHSEGELTPYKLAVPYSSPSKVSIGHIDFEIKRAANGRHFAYASAPIPASWFVDLSTECEEVQL